MTDAERKLWQRLRGEQLGVKFRRQHPVLDYVLDFVALEIKLVVEVDGGQHAEQTKYDQQRTADLEAAGFKVLRFWNNEVLSEIESVVEVILNAVRNPSPPRPSP
ncbi:MAG: endonuclease domain-containing protein [Burkholderiaceae bacterium]